MLIKRIKLEYTKITIVHSIKLDENYHKPQLTNHDEQKKHKRITITKPAVHMKLKKLVKQKGVNI